MANIWRVEWWPIAKVKPYGNNPRRNADAVAAVARSIQEFGFRQPLVVDKAGVIIAGHTRYLAAKTLELQRVPVHVAADLTADQARAYRIADNKTGEAAEWDWELLADEVATLRANEFDLAALGFDENELAELLGPPDADAPDPDQIPAPPAKPVTRPGDLWALGDHRLLCADTGEPATLPALLEGQLADLVHTDPPYNVAVQSRTNGAKFAAAKGAHKHQYTMDRRRAKCPDQLTTADLDLANDNLPEEEYLAVVRRWFAAIAAALRPGGSFYIWGGWANWARYPPALAAAGLRFTQGIIWCHGAPVLARKDFMTCHESCFYGWREGAAHQFHGPRSALDAWHVTKLDAPADGSAVLLGPGLRLECNGARLDLAPPKGEPRRTAQVPADGLAVAGSDAAADLWFVSKVQAAARVHTTEKPVELAARAIRFSSRPGDLVLDPFGGSGSTLMAAEMAGRRARLVELEPGYADVIVTRWENYTGRKAERITTAAPAAGKRRPKQATQVKESH